MLDRQGRVLHYPWKDTVGPIPPITDADGNVPPDLVGKRVDRNTISDIEAPLAGLNWPKYRSYRNRGRYFVEYFNRSLPGKELWWYAAAEGRLLGYDDNFHQFIGSFGPDGFVPAGQQSGERFPGEQIYPTRGWDVIPPSYLIFTRRTWLLEYDPNGSEIARRELPRGQSPEPSPGMALFGLATPATEAGALVGMHRYLRAQEAATGERWILLLYFDEWVPYIIPGIERGWAENCALETIFAALLFLSAAISGLACFLLARRYAFSLGGCIGWALAGLLFGAVGVVLMLCIHQWPARVGCPACGRQRRVDRDLCEHCGAPHALPALDGTEIFETATMPAPANRRPVYQTAVLYGEDPA